ncbi:uncharacterized protein N7459_007091 [Penicillium hispanicum]|uniref:uncharacterized protein n=1 Tax=Penicillium hispanicum TaxID=1080232 RepID=UPI0025406158|nr:uncharacterized protein N7459_007091 [Penicillium hispanicum]KAJ5578127.1 hypothetical protein N7459_007091 [Penicillium hispanicum]
MATQSLLHYLSIALPSIPLQGAAPSTNTTNPRYGAPDIDHIVSWSDFNYGIMYQRYGAILNAKQIHPDPFRSPPDGIRDEATFHLRFGELVLPRIRRALRAGFEQLEPQRLQRQLSPVKFDGGERADILDQFRPDTAFFVAGGSNITCPNRAPGDLTVSWKWRSSMRDSEIRRDRHEYKQTLAQVNFYMKQHGARYGFILTDAEFVAVKRLNANGYLAVAEAVPWKSGGMGNFSVLLGLWYLGMLAAEDQTWALNG